MSTPAQEEFNALVAANASSATHNTHPEDRPSASRDSDDDLDDLSEEEQFRNQQIDSAMRMQTNSSGLALPPAHFDSGFSTGVKGVIADARSYEAARQSKWKARVQAARRSLLGVSPTRSSRSVRPQAGSRSGSESEGDSTEKTDPNEEEFLAQWREIRRRELELETQRGARERRTSPSLRTYGRFDQVDALGYLDAIEKVGRETKVVVFVYDPECEVSAAVEEALIPLVKDHPYIHFVKVHYEDIEFDNAAVPTILAYRNQGDLFANLTGIIEMISDDDNFGTGPLRSILRQHNVL